MLRQVYRCDGAIAVFWEIAYQAARPLLAAYTQAAWCSYQWRGRSHFLIHGTSLGLLPRDGGVSIELAVHRTHEPRATELLADFLKPGMTVIDIGSNLGYYALLESRLVGRSGTVIALEPVPQNAEICKQNIGVNGCSNVVFRQAAIGPYNGRLPLHLSEKSNWHTLHEVHWSTTDILVPVCTLDSLVSELSLNRVDLVRMDLEGYETVVIDGMRKTLEEYSPRLLVEVHPQIVGPEAMRQYLLDLNKFNYSPEWVLDQERDVPWRWYFLGPEAMSMDELTSDWRINIHCRSLTVLFRKDQASDAHDGTATLVANVSEEDNAAVSSA
jgi:FkbM family methyltransferase